MAIEEPTTRRNVLRRIVSELPQRARVKERYDRVRFEVLGPARPGLDSEPMETDFRVFPDTVVGRAMGAINDFRSVTDPAARRTLIRSVFDDLDAFDAEQVAEQYAEDIADLPGVPAPLRYTANRVLIEQRFESATDDLRRARNRMTMAIDLLAGSRPKTRAGRNPLAVNAQEISDAARRVAIANQFRASYNDHVGRYVARQFLRVVPSTGNSSGRVVEVFGDLVRATHVLIVVPGLSNHYTTFHETREQSETLARHAAKEHPGENIAIIEWMGYEVPGWVRGTRAHSANQGGPALRDFVESLDLAPAVEVTVLGHSYGSIVVSEALRVGLRPDRVVFTGSPGVHADHVEELGLTGGSVYALAAPRDVISRLRWHGKNPAAEPFGATRLATEGYGHASYFKPGGLSLRNLLHVALGRVEHVVEAARSHDRAIAKPDLSLGT